MAKMNVCGAIGCELARGASFDPRRWAWRVARLTGDSLFEGHIHLIANFFSDCAANFGLHGQLVCSIAEGHERALKWDSVDLAAYFYQAAGTEELHGRRPDDIRPAAFAGALLQLCGETLVEDHGLSGTRR